MTITEALVSRNAAYSADVLSRGGLAAKGTQKVAVVACMDSRVDVFAALGLAPGEAHVIRNAGGLVTEDTIRSLAISQHLMGTEEILVIHHTGCGMLSFTDEELCSALEAQTGARPTWAPGPSPTWPTACASRSPASRPRPSSPAPTPCVASSWTWPPAAWRRSTPPRRDPGLQQQWDRGATSSPPAYRPSRPPRRCWKT